MPKKPPITELEFLKQTGNHREFSKKLTILGLSANDSTQYAEYVGISWFNLGRQHLAEGKRNIRARCPRTVYSRAYYAVYNVSKSIRYIVNGFVSLKGDDHGKASIDLPNDFPNIAVWSGKISMLYEHRLRADYDNWEATSTEHTLSPAETIKIADEFIDEAQIYLKTKFNLEP
jgi:hypothetical protein